MSKTKALGILICVVAACGVAMSLLKGEPADYAGAVKEFTAGIALIFVRNAIDKAIVK